MKKGLAIFAILAFASSFVACKKDYTCACSYDTGSGTNTTVNYEYKKMKKGDAEDACAAQEASWKALYSGASCSI